MSRLHTKEVLVSHANARLIVYARALLVRPVRVDRRPVAQVAKELGLLPEFGGLGIVPPSRSFQC
jgi:hypothetical protein